VEAEPTPQNATIEDPSAASVRLLGQVTERRIAWLVPIIGLTATAAAALAHHRDWGIGIAAGSALAWLNFRWLAQGLDALVFDATAQNTSQKPRVPIVTYFLAAFRYALIALCVYGIFKFLRIPLVSLLLGLGSLGAATIAASIYEIAKPLKTRP
jgi:hypothetical protein